MFRPPHTAVSLRFTNRSTGSGCTTRHGRQRRTCPAPARTRHEGGAGSPGPLSPESGPLARIPEARRVNLQSAPPHDPTVARPLRRPDRGARRRSGSTMPGMPDREAGAEAALARGSPTTSFCFVYSLLAAQPRWAPPLSPGQAITGMAEGRRPGGITGSTGWPRRGGAGPIPLTITSPLTFAGRFAESGTDVGAAESGTGTPLRPAAAAWGARSPLSRHP